MDLTTLFCINKYPINFFQRWTGWPEQISDELSLAQIDIPKVHHLSVNSSPSAEAASSLSVRHHFLVWRHDFLMCDVLTFKCVTEFNGYTNTVVIWIPDYCCAVHIVMVQICLIVERSSIQFIIWILVFSVPYSTIWIPDRKVQYSDESEFWVSDIQIITVLRLPFSSWCTFPTLPQNQWLKWFLCTS